MSDAVKPKVSVCMITYNHEKFVAQAIESVLMQQVGFPIELIIGEDGSSDHTARIVNEYQEKFPDIITAICREQNIGARKNSDDVRRRVRGDYIALLEADDYWIDPLKLQKQADFLDSHPEYMGCGGYAQVVDQAGTPTGGMLPPDPPPEKIELHDVLRKNHLPTGSVLFRKQPNHAAMMEEWLADLPIGDWPTWIKLTMTGPFHFFHETLSAYRLHEGGVYSAQVTEKKALICINCFEILRSRLPDDLHSIVDETIYNWMARAAVACLMENRKRNALKYLFKMYVRYPGMDWPYFRNTRWILGLLIPGYTRVLKTIKRLTN